MILKINNVVPSFIAKSTQFISAISTLMLTPFIVYNVYQGNYFLASSVSILLCIYSYSAYRCYQNKYSLRLSLFGIAPLITVTPVLALYKLGIVASFWSFPAIFVLYFVLPLRFAVSINIVFLVVIIPVSFGSMMFDEFFRFNSVLIYSSVFIFMCIREINNQYHLLTTLSNTDTLTGLNNRSLLNHSLEQAIQISHRYKTSMTILMIDIDHFKKINDTFGHNTGDDVLKQVSILMRNNFRDPDMLFRVGGEEFLVLLNNSDISDSETSAERLRQAIQKYKFLPNKKVTVSIGVCELNEHKTSKDWMAHCDRRLYMAKENGRNKVIFSEQLISPQNK